MKFSGIGLDSNFIILEHDDAQRSGYFHIQHKSSLVNLGDLVKQGQPIALSGMVGQTIFPHVHFLVFNKEKTASLPIAFNDVQGGVPLAGHLYISGNTQPAVK
ncbi:MAG: M23 family metallopeptidase [Bdellovibrionales bacterium]|nr:M23 family metallopeptidase [Bdellovibrionales bacterium]